jgi:large subunit ribosomal protein L14
MIQPQTCLNVADNSGAKKLMCIRILGTNRRYGFIGNVIIGVVKDATPNLTVKRSDVVRAVIVRTKHTMRRKDGSRLRFDDNAAVIINKEKNPRGTRIFGPIARELKDEGFTKIVARPTEDSTL